MSEVKHTPGTWVADGMTVYVEIGGERHLIGNTYAFTTNDTINGHAYLEGEDNARLFAAAPELYAALKEWAENPDGWNVDQVNHARAIIAKVEA